ncbi:MAG TPA: fused response regulator/phosphatase [Gammaproteobacteria bacterium]|nr:fused response regulator/phosphatase [Gammaproteobacteria bacterium]
MTAASIKCAIPETSLQALIVSDCSKAVSRLEKSLVENDISVVIAKTVEDAANRISDNRIAYIFIDTELPEQPCEETIQFLRERTEDRQIPIIAISSTSNEENLSRSIVSGCDDIIIDPYSKVSVAARLSSLDQIKELKALYRDSINEQLVARRILVNAIDERSLHLKEIGLLRKAKDIFSGDLFLTSRHPDGSLNILIADFTGHGLSAAIGALPVADIFSIMTQKGFDLTSILESINTRLYTLLPTSMFMACAVLNISNDLKRIKVWNGGMPDIFIRDKKRGVIKHRIASTFIPLGITERNINQRDMKVYDLEEGDLIVLYTDGLTEALNNDEEMFGQERLQACLEMNTDAGSVYMSLIDTFNDFCGSTNPSDDITLACIACTPDIMPGYSPRQMRNADFSFSENESWRMYIEMGGVIADRINPVPLIVEEINRTTGCDKDTERLSEIMAVLYKNAVGNRNNSSTYIKIGVKDVNYNGSDAVLVRMEDGGKEISAGELDSSPQKRKEWALGAGYPEDSFLYEINSRPGMNSSGNRFKAIICTRLQRVI